MNCVVCVGASSLGYPQGGGHLWVALNWALGLRQIGCRVIWLEAVWPDVTCSELIARVGDLRSRLAPYGLTEIALAQVAPGLADVWPELSCMSCEDAANESELLVNLQDRLAGCDVERFRRSALVDIDPGLRQLWIDQRKQVPAEHDIYFTIGETVGTAEARFPDAGLTWHYTPPPVCLQAWPVAHTPPSASATAYTTVTHWWAGEERVGDGLITNDKRSAFAAYADLPAHVPAELELAVGAGKALAEEKAFWEPRGWRVTDAWQVTSTPWEYQSYIQRSRGEFSCVKPSCILLQNAWISDRTICYLASGKPAVIEHTGPSRFLPDNEGLLRFRTFDEAVAMVRRVEADYEHHCGAARALAEEYFDAEKVCADVLERALAVRAH